MIDEENLIRMFSVKLCKVTFSSHFSVSNNHDVQVKVTGFKLVLHRDELN